MMEMSKMYTDYINRTALTVPDQFIEVKSGETISVPSEILEQIEYHAENQTLIHLVLSALNQYLQPNQINKGSEAVLLELAEIKQMLQGYRPNSTRVSLPLKKAQPEVKDLDMKEVEDILDVFGG
jgi:hypothetical protein